MVKWAVAAIPALILLSLIALGLTALFSGVVATMHRSEYSPSQSPSVSPSVGVTRPREPPFPSSMPDSCKGSPEPDKCMELERRLAEETPEQRAKRQHALEAERKANMAKLK